MSLEESITTSALKGGKDTALTDIYMKGLFLLQGFHLQHQRSNQPVQQDPYINFIRPEGLYSSIQVGVYAQWRLAMLKAILRKFNVREERRC